MEGLRDNKPQGFTLPLWNCSNRKPETVDVTTPYPGSTAQTGVSCGS